MVDQIGSFIINNPIACIVAFFAAMSGIIVWLIVAAVMQYKARKAAHDFDERNIYDIDNSVEN